MSRQTVLTVLYAATALLFVLLAGYVWLAFTTTDVSIPQPQNTTDNVFQNMAQLHPKGEVQQRRVAPPRVNVPAEPFNPHNGVQSTGVVLTVFDDPSCVACRQQVNAVLQRVPNDVRVVYKFLPADSKNATGGLFRQLAWEQDLWWQAEDRLKSMSTPMDMEKWVTFFGEIWLDNGDLRRILAEKGEQYMEEMDKDALLAQAANLRTTPQFVLNQYVVDGNPLEEQNIAEYIRRIRQKEPITKTSDFNL